MKIKLLLCLVFLSFVGSGSTFSAELKPYQKEALKKLEALHGGSIWPMVRQQFESVIAGASEEQAKTIVKMVADGRANASAGDSADVDEVEGGDDYEVAQAAREDLEKQISAPYDAFVDFIVRLGVARSVIAEQARSEVYKSEKGARLKAMTEVFTRDKFVTNQSLSTGLEELRLARERLANSKKFYKVTLPNGSPPDNTETVTSIIRDAAGRIAELNNRYGRIAAEIKKKIDPLPVGGKYESQIRALMSEQENHNRTLSAEVVKIVNDMNGRIANEDPAVFNWFVKPLLDAKPQTGPAARN